MNDWIDVNDRLPNDNQHIIIYCDGAFVLVAQYREDEFYDAVQDGDEYFETVSRCVTHWMPLPEPPLTTQSTHDTLTQYDNNGTEK